MKKSKGNVIRINNATYERLKKYKGEDSYAEFLDKQMDMADTIANARTVYIVDDFAYDDIAVARGQAIIRAVEMKTEVRFPEIAIVIGEDNGN